MSKTNAPLVIKLPPGGPFPLWVKPKRAASMLDCGNTRLYQLLDSGELISAKEGRSRKILVSSIYDYIERTFAKADTGLGAAPSPRRQKRPGAAEATPETIASGSASSNESRTSHLEPGGAALPTPGRRKQPATDAAAIGGAAGRRDNP